MSFTHARRSRVLLGADHISGFLTEAGEDVSIDVEESTTLLDQAKTYVVGPEDATVSLQGLFDGDPDAIHDILTGLKRADPVVYSYVPGGFTVGAAAKLARLHQVAYQIGSSVSGLVQAQMSGQATGGARDGVVLAGLDERGTSGDAAGVEAGGGDGAVGHLHVTAVDGTVDVKVQHSTDAQSWVDLITFAQVDEPAALRVEEHTSVHEHLRASWTVSGTATFAVTAAGL